MTNTKTVFQTIVPHQVRGMLRATKSLLLARLWWPLKRIGKQRSSVFETIYKERLWGTAGKGDGWFSGPGSTQSYTKEYEAHVVSFIRNNAIRKIVDVGCGDFQVANRILTQIGNTVDYTGVDVVADLIERNNRLFAGKGVTFIARDGVEHELPDADLVLVREVCQHLSNDSVGKLIAHLRKFRYALITEHVSRDASRPNVDIRDGHFARVDIGSGTFLDQPPFNLAGEEVLRVDLEDGVTCLRTLLVHGGIR